MARGGRRTGKPGAGYTNRTDLNQNRALPVQVGPSQGYGQAAAQARAQRAVPIARPARPAVAAPPAPVAPAPPVPLDAPTARPAEPLTAGAPLGAGPGPEAIAALGLGGDAIADIRALYQRYPQYDELRQIIEEFEEGGF